MRQFTSMQAEKGLMQNHGGAMTTEARRQVLVATKIVRSHQDQTKSFHFFRQVLKAVEPKK